MAEHNPRTRLRAAAPAAVLALLCIALAVHAELARVTPNPSPPSAAAITPRAARLLDDLRVGERIAGWTVSTLTGPRERAIEIGLVRDQLRFVVTIAPMGARPENPALQTDRYAIYYGHAVPNDRPIPEGAVRAITAALARRIAEHEHEIPEP
jgi:hypothetical protein